MRAVSKKTAARNREYARQRDVFLDEHPMCEIRWDDECTGLATLVHHKAGRVGKAMLDESRWVAGCDTCHRNVHGHVAEAYERGVLLRRNAA
jgi:hypothetical protein